MEDLRVTWQEVGCNFHTSLRRSGFSTRYVLLAQHHRELPVPAVAALSHGREPGPSHTDWTRLFPQAGILGTGSSRTCTPLKTFFPHCQALAWLLPPLRDLHSPKERGLLAKHWQIKQWANISALWKKGMEARGIGRPRAGKGQNTQRCPWKAHSRFPLQQRFPNCALQGTVYNKQFIILTAGLCPLASWTLLNCDIYSEPSFFFPLGVW